MGFGDRDNLARQARLALLAEERERPWVEEPYPHSPLASRRAPERETTLDLTDPTVLPNLHKMSDLELRSGVNQFTEDDPGSDWVDLVVPRELRDRLAELAEGCEPPVRYQLAVLVHAWDVAWRVKSGVRTLRWLR